MNDLVHRNKYKSSLLLVLLTIFVLINSFSSWLYYCNYQNGMSILAEIATKSGEDGIDIVAQLLKDTGMNNIEQGKQLLEQYGYLNGGKNLLFQQFTRNVMASVIFTFCLFTLLFFFLLMERKRTQRKEKERFSKVEQTIEGFRDNHYEVFLNPDDEEEEEKIKVQLEALASYLRLLKEQARREKEDTKVLVSDISHQLKTPVAALDACFTVLLNEDLSREEQAEFKVRCRSALDGLEVLLQSLLQISKMETGLIQVNRKRLPIMETIVEAVNRVYPSASAKEMEIVVECDETLENYEIMQDKKWLSEAIINVLDNAIKYSPMCSEVTIRLQKRTGFVRIEIEDQGGGIPKEEYHKIFQRFYRGSQPFVRDEKGSGIGLFLSREIIEQHHGTITVSSCYKKETPQERNYGSTFILQLPDTK